VTAIAAGGSEAGYALRFDGTVSAWGYNGQGQLGDATTTSHYLPAPVNGLTGVVAIGGGNASGFGMAVLSG
jgi:alpha-tubulin suppressor-like RCC1 family protein